MQSAKTRPGADCGSDHELFIAKFRLKLKKVGKTTRPFRYDLNQIPYDYTVEVRNRFKRLDLIDKRYPRDTHLCVGCCEKHHVRRSLKGQGSPLFKSAVAPRRPDQQASHPQETQMLPKEKRHSPGRVRQSITCDTLPRTI